MLCDVATCVCKATETCDLLDKDEIVVTYLRLCKRHALMAQGRVDATSRREALEVERLLYVGRFEAPYSIIPLVAAWEVWDGNARTVSRHNSLGEARAALAMLTGA